MPRSPKKFPVRTASDICAAVHEIGFLPFYSSPVGDFSLRALTDDPGIWLSMEKINPWYFRNEVIYDERIVYGRLFDGKLGFADLDWYPHFINARRAGRSAQELFDAGELPAEAWTLFETLPPGECWSENELKDAAPAGFRALSRVLADLQTWTLWVTARFDWKRTRAGVPYGWGIAGYARTEDVFEAASLALPGCTPEESFAKLRDRVLEIVPRADEASLEALLGRPRAAQKRAKKRAR